MEKINEDDEPDPPFHRIPKRKTSTTPSKPFHPIPHPTISILDQGYGKTTRKELRSTLYHGIYKKFQNVVSAVTVFRESQNATDNSPGSSSSTAHPKVKISGSSRQSSEQDGEK